MPFGWNPMWIHVAESSFSPKLEDEMTKGLQKSGGNFREKKVILLYLRLPIAPYGKFPGKNFSLKRSAM